MPNAVTLMSEYCPDQRRATLTNANVLRLPAWRRVWRISRRWMIPQWGWRSVLSWAA